GPFPVLIPAQETTDHPRSTVRIPFLPHAFAGVPIQLSLLHQAAILVVPGPNTGLRTCLIRSLLTCLAVLEVPGVQALLLPFLKCPLLLQLAILLPGPPDTDLLGPVQLAFHLLIAVGVPGAHYPMGLAFLVFRAGFLGADLVDHNDGACVRCFGTSRITNAIAEIEA